MSKDGNQQLNLFPKLDDGLNALGPILNASNLLPLYGSAQVAVSKRLSTELNIYSPQKNIFSEVLQFGHMFEAKKDTPQHLPVKRNMNSIMPVRSCKRVDSLHKIKVVQ